jgi:hypothetical protein
MVKTSSKRPSEKEKCDENNNNNKVSFSFFSYQQLYSESGIGFQIPTLFAPARTRIIDGGEEQKANIYTEQDEAAAPKTFL